ncbi:chorismate mutase [bacterium]|nr:chorismate mutase [bacterium]
MTISLEDLRKEIHDVDSDLVQIFCRRMQLAAEIGRLKRESGQAIIDRKREEEVINRVLALPHDPVDTKVLEDFFRLVILLSREEQFKRYAGDEENGS